MRRIFIRIAYDGTDYNGWQTQGTLPTISSELYKAIEALTGEDRSSIHLIGSGRTDSGVHARDNAAVFETGTRIPAARFAPALNRYLPGDIRVLSSEECPGDWHPRKRKSEKTYVYRLYSDPTEDPLYRRFAMFCHYPLDLEKMRLAAGYLTGEHDFTSFANPGSQILLSGGSPVRRVYEISIRAQQEVPGRTGFCGLTEIRVRGSGFLYNMVRIIAGTLTAVGTGLMEPDAIPGILESRDRSKAGPTAQARGLTLERTVFEDMFESASGQEGAARGEE